MKMKLKKLTIDKNLLRNYELPDGSILNVGKERFQSTEILFQPKFYNKGDKGIHQIVHTSVMNCNQERHKELFNNIVLAGGGSLFEGFSNRLTRELSLLTEMKCKVQSPIERRYSTYIGGSIIGSLTTFKDLCISRKDYNETGAEGIHKKVM